MWPTRPASSLTDHIPEVTKRQTRDVFASDATYWCEASAAQGGSRKRALEAGDKRASPTHSQGLSFALHFPSGRKSNAYRLKLAYNCGIELARFLEWHVVRGFLEPNQPLDRRAQ